LKFLIGIKHVGYDKNPLFLKGQGEIINSQVPFQLATVGFSLRK